MARSLKEGPWNWPLDVAILFLEFEHLVDQLPPLRNTRDGSPVDQANISRGIFGATLGVDRLLGLFEKHNIKASWFVPGHTLESFPKQIEKIRDGGHEM